MEGPSEHRKDTTSTNGEEPVDQMSDYYLPKNDSALWISFQ
jgi:hypothetical protein